MYLYTALCYFLVLNRSAALHSEQEVVGYAVKRITSSLASTLPLQEFLQG